MKLSHFNIGYPGTLVMGNFNLNCPKVNLSLNFIFSFFMRKQNLQPYWSVQFRNYTCYYWVKKKAEIAEIEKKVAKLCIYPCQTRDHTTVEKLSEQFCVVGKTQSWKRAAPGGWSNLASKAGPLDGTDLGHRSEHRSGSSKSCCYWSGTSSVMSSENLRFKAIQNSSALFRAIVMTNIQLCYCLDKWSCNWKFPTNRFSFSSRWWRRA